jgi:hypothetical protein
VEQAGGCRRSVFQREWVRVHHPYTETLNQIAKQPFHNMRA